MNDLVILPVPLGTLCQFSPAILTFASTTALPAENTIAVGTYSDVITVTSV